MIVGDLNGERRETFTKVMVKNKVKGDTAGGYHIPIVSFNMHFFNFIYL